MMTMTVMMHEDSLATSAVCEQEPKTSATEAHFRDYICKINNPNNLARCLAKLITTVTYRIWLAFGGLGEIDWNSNAPQFSAQS